MEYLNTHERRRRLRIKVMRWRAPPSGRSGGREERVRGTRRPKGAARLGRREVRVPCCAVLCGVGLKGAAALGEPQRRSRERSEREPASRSPAARYCRQPGTSCEARTAGSEQCERPRTAASCGSRARLGLWRCPPQCRRSRINSRRQHHSSLIINHATTVIHPFPRLINKHSSATRCFGGESV